MDLERPSGWLRTAEGSPGQSSRLRTMKIKLERYTTKTRSRLFSSPRLQNGAEDKTKLPPHLFGQRRSTS